LRNLFYWKIMRDEIFEIISQGLTILSISMLLISKLESKRCWQIEIESVAYNNAHDEAEIYF